MITRLYPVLPGWTDPVQLVYSTCFQLQQVCMVFGGEGGIS